MLDHHFSSPCTLVFGDGKFSCTGEYIWAEDPNGLITDPESFVLNDAAVDFVVDCFTEEDDGEEGEEGDTVSLSFFSS